MNENLLHFIWKLKLFSVNKLLSTNGEKIHIISIGIQNLNTGPDFFNAKLEIGNQVWAGNVEIHINSSDWYRHNHETDENYDAVVLHVVWEHDVEIFRKDNTKITTLELKKYISKEVLDNYNQLFSKKRKWINCENEIKLIDTFIFENWLERLYFERLEKKSELINQLLATNNNNWEAALFILLAKSFGLKVNGEAFLNFANSFDFSIVRKVSNNAIQLEALFFGQAGLLEDECDTAYFKQLKYEHEFLKVKFNLKPISRRQIQFFRLRPHNFPTIRISQLVFLYNKYQNLFSKIIETESLDSFYNLFEVSTLPFWEAHFTFEKESKKSTKKLTKSFIDLILINTIIPLKFVYLKSLGKSDYSALFNILEQIKPEKNVIISKFNDLKIKSTNAFNTQALLQLKNEYCSKQLCLQCAIGKTILNKN